LTRIYTSQPLAINVQVELEKEPGVHLVGVLRKRSGEPLTVFNGDGFDYAAEVIQTGKSVSLLVRDKTRNLRESPLRISLAQGISRSERMDYTLQKSVELGVMTIQPLITQKSSVKLKPDRINKKLRHWRSVVISACEQSGRSVVPPVASPLTLPEWLAQPDTECTRIVLDPTAETSLTRLEVAGECTLVIGPESGFEEREIQLLSNAGALRATLGPRVLRTETVALAAISVMQARLGDFR
jgi:16S rRNA (uracil1498-N3)-methyltransferase